MSKSRDESDAAGGTVSRKRRTETSQPTGPILLIVGFDSKLLWANITDREDEIKESDRASYSFAGRYAGFTGVLSVG